MSNKELTTVTVVDNVAKTEFSYQTTQSPKKTTLGNSYPSTLSAEGIAEIQKKFQVHSEKDWAALLKQTFGLSDSHIGTRGPKWDDAESRARYSVLVDGVAFEPTFSAKQVARNKVSVEKVFEVPVTPVAVAPAEPVKAVADQVVVAPEPSALNADEEKLVTKLKGLLATGKHTKDVLMTSLVEKLAGNVQRATEIFAVVEKPVEEAFVL